MKRIHFKIPTIWIAVIILYIVSVRVTPSTFTWMQIRNLMKVVPFLGIAALGHSIVVLVAGTDLSIAGMVTVTVLIACRVMDFGNGSMFFAVLYPLLLVGAIGVLKGLIITKFKVLPLITTMAVNYIITGACLIISGGSTTGRVSPAFEVLAGGYVFQSVIGDVIPISFMIFLLIGIILWFVLTKTRFGYEVYATGSNPAAAYVNGVNTSWTIVKAYVICSLCAAVTGFLLAAYVHIPDYAVGDLYATNSLAAVVIGGTLMTGGVGGVGGSIGGAVFMTLLNSFMNTLRAAPGIQNIVRGTIIITGIWVASGDVSRRAKVLWNSKIGTLRKEAKV